MKRVLIVLSVSAGVVLAAAYVYSKIPAIIFGLYKGRYMTVISRLQTGCLELERDAHFPGWYRLPPDLQRASRHGKVVFKRLEDDHFLIAFSVWRGKAYNMWGYLFASRPLGPVTYVEMEEPATLFVAQAIDDNWYEVYWDLD